MKKKVYHLYIHVNKNTGEIYYVGKNTGDKLHYRWYSRKYKKEEVNTIMLPVLYEDEDKAIEMRNRLIQYYQSIGECKYNIDGFTKGEVSKKKLGEHNRGAGNPSARAIICLTNGKVFQNVKGEGGAVEWFKQNLDINLNAVMVCRCCRGQANYTAGGYQFMYYDEYLEKQVTE